MNLTNPTNPVKRPALGGIFLAVLAAALYAVNSPFSKLLLDFVPPTLMAGLLYVGAGIGMVLIALVRKCRGVAVSESRLSRKELPFTLGMIVLDVLAPIFLLIGLSSTTAENASLLNNFEIVATAVIALAVFKERISPRLWGGIALVTLSCAILTVGSVEGLLGARFSVGSLFVLLAAVCWGLENNCTRMISSKDPMQIVLLKGIFSGGTSVVIGLLLGERAANLWSVLAVLVVGFVAYGMSIFFYIYAQRSLGAARTGAYYAVAPFIGALLSLLVFRELPPPSFFVALVFMAGGAFLSSQDGPIFGKRKRK